LYVEEEDYESLRHSIQTFPNFDQLKLASDLEQHNLLELRRVSSYLYQINNKFEQAVDLSKQDKLYNDAISAAAASKKTELAEDLLKFFLQIAFTTMFCSLFVHML